MSVARDVAAGTKVARLDGKEGEVIRSYETGVVTVRFYDGVMSMMRHDLNYVADRVSQDFPIHTWGGNE